MSQNVRYQINISGFFIKRSSIGTAKLVGSDFFIRCYLAGIFFHHIFHCLNPHTPALGGEEEGIFMSGKGIHSLSTSPNIFHKSGFHLISEIHNHLISAFSGDSNPVIFKIYIRNIKSDTLGNTDPCTQKKCENSKISFFCLFVISSGLSGQRFSAGFHMVQKKRHFICIQADNGFFMLFRHIYKKCRIMRNILVFMIIGIEASKRGHFPGKTFFPVCHHLIILTPVYFQIFHIFLNIYRLQIIQISHCKLGDRIFTVDRIIFH